MRLLRSRSFYWLLVAAVLLLIILANAHLVYIAIQSDPGCATSGANLHVTSGEVTYSAAKPAC